MDPRSVAAGRGAAYAPEAPVRSARRGYRHRLASLAYVRIDHGNGGIIRNLSDSGLAVQAVGRLHPGQVVHLRFELLKPKIRVEATAQVSWAEASGQAGLRFLEISTRTRRLVKDWVLTDLLGAARDLGSGRIFGSDAPVQTRLMKDGLLMSAPSFVPIHLDAESSVNPSQPSESEMATEEISAEMPLRLSWWPMDISRRGFTFFIDSLIVCSSVLLFSVVAVAMTGIFPSRIAALVLGLGVTLIFALLYRYLFTTFAGMTVGRRLAQLASEDMHWLGKTEEDGPRFR